MDIDTMEAGPEMDLAMARLMGWTARKTFLGVEVDDTTTRPGHCEVGRIFAPSTNIAQAWEVAQKLEIGVLNMGSGGFRAGLNDPSKKWTSWWEEADYGRSQFVADAPTAPIAICRAALKAMGAKEIPWGEPGGQCPECGVGPHVEHEPNCPTQ